MNVRWGIPDGSEFPAAVAASSDRRSCRDERNMKLFCGVLQASGYRTLEATTGVRAVELAIQHAPDLVLMDIHLLDTDGVEALNRLRADERSSSLPVLALTAQAMEGERERSVAAGFDGYLSKPIDIAQFVTTVERYSEVSRASGS
jgi:CheY-like chemotaxis protein